MPSFEDLHARLLAAAGTMRGTLAIAGTFEDHPVLRLRAGAPAGRPLLVIAGIHGEEPASPLGFVEWLETDAPTFLDRIDLTAFPCLNPVGFVRGTRGSRDVPDLNRRFDDPGFPLTRILAAALGPARFDLLADLHEDSDFKGAYCYELGDGPPWLAERILAAAATRVPVSDGEVVGDYTTRGGIIRPDPAARRERIRAAGGGMPVALWLHERTASRVVTFESPGARPLTERIAATRAALNAIATFLIQ